MMEIQQTMKRICCTNFDIHIKIKQRINIERGDIPPLKVLFVNHTIIFFSADRMRSLFSSVREKEQKNTTRYKIK